MRGQRTLQNTISCRGVGLHSGKPVTLTLRPAPPDTGVIFNRKQADGQPVALTASISNLVPTELCTAIHSNGTQIKTIEHVLSALIGMDIDNVHVDLDEDEVPAMDGSAAAFVDLIKSAGVVSQSRQQPFLKMTKPIEIVDGGRWVRIEPNPTPRITYSIQYDHPLIQIQSYEFDCSADSFEQEISGARTFAFLNEVQALWARGLGKGGSLDNTVVLSETSILNDSGLRYQDEFVRHKILDLIGDFALLGRPFIGHLIANRSGHAMHTKLVEAILARPDAWVLLRGTQDLPREHRSSTPGSASPSGRIPLHVSPAL